MDKKDEFENITFVQDEKIDKSIYNHHFAFLHPEVRGNCNDVRTFYAQNSIFQDFNIPSLLKLPLLR